jgi:hypothetical protein
MRTRATKQQIAVTIGLLIAVAAAGWWWSPHIYWSYLLSRNNYRMAPAQVVEMPTSRPAAGWFACRAGALSFKLPASMAEEAERALAKSPHALSITTPTHELTMSIPAEIPADARPNIELFAARMKVTLMQLLAESYRTGTADFRWTMSRDELYRHQMLLDLSTLYPHHQVLVVETRSNDAWEGMLVFHESKSMAKFEWQLRSGKSAGYLMFSATKGILDFDDVRAVCQSLACDESRLKSELSKDQLAVLADAMDITPE